MPDVLPSIEQVAAEFSKGLPSAQPAQEQKGGTATDPALATPAAVVEPAAATEPPKEEPKEEAKKEEPKDPMSSRFAALARKEKEFRKERDEREKAWATKQKEIEDRQKSLEERESKLTELRKSPLKTLKDLGITFADLTQDAIGGYKEPELSPEQKMRDDIKAEVLKEVAEKLGQSEEAVKSKLQQIQEREMQLALREVMDTIRETASDEKYELIQMFGDDAHNLVKDVIVQYQHTHDKLLDYTEACDIVEQWYEDRILNPVTGTKKAQSRIKPSEPTITAKPVPSQIAPKVSTTTLKNADSSARSAPVDLDKLSKPEAIAHLAKELKFL